MNLARPFDYSESVVLPIGFSLFCDLDGTLVDTNYANYLSYRKALVKVTQGVYDIDYSEERLNSENLKRRLPSLTEVQIQQTASLKAEYFNTFLSETHLNARLADFITSHYETNPIVLVSCCRELRAINVLKHHNLLGYFSRVICKEALLLSDSSNKFASAISIMGVNREEVVIFEDEHIGIEQAISAGVPYENIYKVSSGMEILS